MSDDSYKASNPNSLITPGQLLREKRLKLAMDAKQASDDLKITCSKLEAIETDNYGMFSSLTYVRGHLRNYARLVDMPEVEIMDCYYAYINSFSKNLFESTNGEGDKKRTDVDKFVHALPWWWPYMLLAVLTILWIVIYPFIGHDSQQQITDASNTFTFEDTPPSIENVVVQGMDNTPQSQENNNSHINTTTTRNTEANIRSIRDKSTGDEAPVDNNVTDSLIIEQPVAADVNTPSVVQDITTSSVDTEKIVMQSTVESVNALQTQTKIDQLVLSFDDDCWLEVTDAEGRVLMAKLRRAGDRLVLLGRAPFDIMLGNVRAAEIRLNGKAIALRPIGTRRTLRFTVGNT